MLQQELLTARLEIKLLNKRVAGGDDQGAGKARKKTVLRKSFDADTFGAQQVASSLGLSPSLVKQLEFVEICKRYEETILSASADQPAHVGSAADYGASVVRCTTQLMPQLTAILKERLELAASDITGSSNATYGKWLDETCKLMGMLQAHCKTALGRHFD
ncbi:hypothetical protein BC831DRAFT_516944 [Entophlyctis helioformis]|nr:hypothetical protein BC831DRAFT_516944 [Entophlyctis helioformis]